MLSFLNKNLKKEITMTGYETFEYINKMYSKATVTSLNDIETVSLIKKCELSIYAVCGELKRLSSPAVTQALVDFIQTGKEFKTICGKYLHGGDNDVNPLIRACSDNGCIGVNGNTHFLYSSASPLEQVFFGSMHAIVFDRGKYVFIERPHGYMQNDEIDGILIEGAVDSELVETVYGFVWPDFIVGEISGTNDVLAKNNTLKTDDIRWAEGFNSFSNEQEFNACIKSYKSA
jgi:hypothetical protein